VLPEDPGVAASHPEIWSMKTLFFGLNYNFKK